TVNDTSTVPTPKIEITQIAGTEEPENNETTGADAPYAKIKPENVADGFVISGKSELLPERTEITVTITNPETNRVDYTGKATVGADGTWTHNVLPFTQATAADATLGVEAQVVQGLQNYSPTVSYQIKAAARINGETVTDTDSTIAAPKVVDKYLMDDLTDEAPKVNEYYAQAGVRGADYIGRIDSATNFDSALNKASGLTNDKDATFHFTLDKALDDTQSIKVYRYQLGTLTAENGNKTEVEYGDTDVSGQLGAPAVQADGTVTYTLTPTTPLGDTYNAAYRYKTVIVDKVTGQELSSSNFDFRLDTLVEQMDVINMNSDQKTMTLKARDLSELSAIISFQFKDASGNYSTVKNVTQTGVGEYTISMPDWNRFHVGSVKVVTVDAAGNTGETDITALRNLWTAITPTEGVKVNDPPGRPLGLNLHVDQDTGANPVRNNQQKVASAANGGLVGNDTNQSVYLGLDNYPGALAPKDVGGAQLSNGALGFTTRAAGGTIRKALVELGAGDDSLHIRGNVLDFSRDGYVDMGAGNDKISIGGSLLTAAHYHFKLGEGNDILEIHNSVAGDSKAIYDMGEGHDIIRVSGNFSGGKTINMGDGDDQIVVGGRMWNGISGVESNIDMGDGNDLIQVGSMSYKTNINFGKGNDTMIIGYTLDDQATGTMDFGAGNDRLTVGDLRGLYAFRMGDGDDIVTLTGRLLGNNVIDGGGDGHDTLVITNTGSVIQMNHVINFETIDLSAAGSQRIGLSVDYIKNGMGDTTKHLYIKGSAADVVDLGNNNKAISSQDYTLGGVTGKRYKDGGRALEKNWDYWEKIGTDTKEGITYDKYTHTAASGAPSEEYVYIQQGIQII
ncbi:hypothetical protein, partial [Rodentibacter rarus]|uniref:hypothetical protein n=1 Tax=Rodentibacter rarus TaxID=1908260 RepID=UPI00130152C3